MEKTYGKPAKKFKAFTLVELIIVMAIIGILSGLGYGAFTYAKRMARNTQRKSALREISTFIEDYKGSCTSTSSWSITINNCSTVTINRGNCGQKQYTLSKMPDISTCQVTANNCADGTTQSDALKICYNSQNCYPIGVYLEGTSKAEKISL